ncbi:hypothetical protein KCU82_g14710, partial [Aureobasidium melanogenum]
MNEKLKKCRAVTSCVECHRRKKKCDRKRPCNNCISRRVAESCIYEHNASTRDDVHVGSSMTGSISAAQDSESQLAQGLSNDSGPRTTDELPTANSHVDQSELWTTHILAQDVMQTLGGESQRAAPLVQTPWHTRLSDYQDLASQLPHISSIRNIVEYYFEHMNWLYEIVQQYYFNSLLTQWVEVSEATASINLGLLSRDLQYFPALIFQIMALTLMYIPLSEAAKLLDVTDGRSLDIQSNHYGDLGMKLMDLLGRRNPSVVGVQHDLVRFAWLKNFGCGKNSLRSLQDAV